MINRIARLLGLKVHVWVAEHPSGYNIRCKHCGERRSLYLAWITPPMPSWWETTESGDGSCKHGTKEQPERWPLSRFR